MLKKLIWNDIRQNKLLSCTTTFFMAISAMILSLTALLFSSLLSAVDGLMQKAQVPDIMQMHTGELDEMELTYFVKECPAIREWQICRFLNLDNSQVTLGDYSLVDSTQDNGLCVQGTHFDYLLDMQNKCPEVLSGQVYPPICYRAQYDLKIGDKMTIGSHEFVIAGFVRDAQMNSMMASSKRFLINESDYEKLKAEGKEEYLIEFLLWDKTDANAVSTTYTNQRLPANGPTITKPLIRMMNTLSDGTMIFIIFLVGIVVLLISLLCIRFILFIRMERDRKEIGMLKAVGIKKKSIKKIYFSKYMLFSICGGILGLGVAVVFQKPMTRQIQELYGVSYEPVQMAIFSLFAIIVVEGMILFFVWRNLKKIDKLSVLSALVLAQKQEKRWRQYLLIGTVISASAFLMLVVQNLYNTLSDPKFVTYMGIGQSDIRMDIQHTKNNNDITAKIVEALEQDIWVEKYVVLQTRNYPVVLSNGEVFNLAVEMGNHTVFPISYSKGTSPKNNMEIAISSLSAQELGLSVGDTLQLKMDGYNAYYTVCGIYSDITNGGKTAKISNRTDHAPMIWSVVYISLKESITSSWWIDQYRQMGANVTDIEDYIHQTYGQTLGQLHLVSKVVTGIAIMVICIVILLFMRLIIERNRYSISVYKALGFTNRRLKYFYFTKGMVSVIAGMVIGLLLGNLCGESLCGIILKSFGADHFRFVIAWEQVLFVIPAIILLVTVVSIWIGIANIQQIRAYECCVGRE